MGCCLSAGKAKAPPVAAATPSPSPLVEEESVTEVVVQSVSVAVPDPIVVPSAPEVSDSEAQLPVSLSSPEISQSKSDICSVTHSLSTATTATAAASILEDDALSKPHRPPPPPPPPSRRSRPERISRSPAPSQVGPRETYLQPAKCGFRSPPTKRLTGRSKASFSVAGNSWPKFRKKKPHEEARSSSSSGAKPRSRGEEGRCSREGS